MNKNGTFRLAAIESFGRRLRFFLGKKRKIVSEIGFIVHHLQRAKIFWLEPASLSVGFLANQMKLEIEFPTFDWWA